MDRATAYPLEETTEIDILNSNKFAMIGLAKLSSAILGPGPWLHGLACTPGSGLTVSVAGGQIYTAVMSVDATAYSSLGTDTHTIVKQGLVLDPTVLNCPAPGTAGQSINYLVQVGYADTDTGGTVLPFYNASNPSIPFSGPGGSGSPVNTVRSAQCLVQVKAGAAATTGSQTTPSPDSGFTAAYVVTVANGASSIVTGNIALVANAPFIAGLMNSHHGGVAGQAPKVHLDSEVQGTLPYGNLPATVGKVTGAFTVGHIITAADTTGTGQDGGLPGTAAAPTYLNHSNNGQTLGIGVYNVDTTTANGGAFNNFLPASPALGAALIFADMFKSCSTNNYTLLRNGHTIEGIADDLVVDVDGMNFQISWDGTTWRLE